MSDSVGKTVLITGASGFLGKHLIEELVGDPEIRVRALVRRGTLFLEQRGVEVVLGDVCEPEVCLRAVAGVSEIYHVAGLVSRDPDDSSAMYRLHVEGTRALMGAASEEESVVRLVIVSTSGTIAVSESPDEISDEAKPYRLKTVSKWPYYLSKIYQERTAFKLARDLGLNVVIVNPSLLLGPGDERGSSTGDVEKLVRGRMPLIPHGGGVAFVDVRDAARGCVLAMEVGKSGERYLLSAVNMTVSAFLGRVARLAGVPAPRSVRGGAGFLKGTGRVVGALFRKLDYEPPFDEQTLEMAEHTWYVDASKAERELGWGCRDSQETLVDTVFDLQRRHGLGQFTGSVNY